MSWDSWPQHATITVLNKQRRNHLHFLETGDKDIIRRPISHFEQHIYATPLPPHSFATIEEAFSRSHLASKLSKLQERVIFERIQIHPTSSVVFKLDKELSLEDDSRCGLISHSKERMSEHLNNACLCTPIGVSKSDT